ncbi:MAG TPA: Crp/Fnr family transcriptional regulator [Flavobacteriaceae bacterium]|nr:Crp/Fnr family transcriptional regulator [Flavobacteriaceae bacterium]
MDITPLLRYINRYVSLSPEEEAYLQSTLSCRTYLKNQYLLQQGDVCKASSFILQGCVKMFYIDPDGQEHIILLGVEDWWTSDIASFINQQPSVFNIQCLENTTLAQFEYHQIEDIYQHVPKLERFFRMIVERGLAAAQQRLIRNFSMNAKERYLYFRQTYPKIEQRIPQYMVASYLGITKEFLSKIKRQLATES